MTKFNSGGIRDMLGKTCYNKSDLMPFDKLSNSIFPKSQKAVCHLVCSLFTASVSTFKAARLKLCMQPESTRGLVLGHVRSASEASEAVSWYVLFGVSKNHRRERFFGSWLKSKVAQRPQYRETGWPQIRPPTLSEAKNSGESGLNIKDKFGRTAFMLACLRAAWILCVRILLFLLNNWAFFNWPKKILD